MRGLAMVGCVALLSLTACASVKTTQVGPNAAPGDGMVYWLPKKALLVTVTMAKGEPTIDIKTSEAVPDVAAGPFLASFRRNFIGKNELKIKVNDKGLLDSSKAVTTSDLSTIFESLAGIAGRSAVDNVLSDKSMLGCPADATMTIKRDVNIPPGDGNPASTVHTEGDFKQCPITITVQSVDAGTLRANSKYVNPPDADGKKSYSGFFYRQNMPYFVVVEVGNLNTTGVVLMPNASGAQYVPVQKSLFADNESNLDFNDGVLTEYHQILPGEGIALVQLPAKVLKAYFEAIGTMFTQRSGRLKQETDYEAALITAMKAQMDNEKCIIALKAKDEAQIAELCK